MRIENISSDCQFKLNPGGRVELEFSIELETNLLVQCVISKLCAEGILLRQPKANQLSFNKIISGVLKPIPFTIEVQRVGTHNDNSSKVVIGAEYQMIDGGSVGRVLKTMRSLMSAVCSSTNSESSLPQSESRLMEHIALDPHTNPILLRFLAAHESPEVRTAVADNPSAPIHALNLLAGDNDPDVRYAVAENHNVSPAILGQLIEDPNPYVACRAQKTLERVMPAPPLVAPATAAITYLRPQAAYATV